MKYTLWERTRGGIRVKETVQKFGGDIHVDHDFPDAEQALQWAIREMNRQDPQERRHRVDL